MYIHKEGHRLLHVRIQGLLTNVDAKLYQGVRCITSCICANLFRREHLYHKGWGSRVSHPRALLSAQHHTVCQSSVSRQAVNSHPQILRPLASPRVEADQTTRISRRPYASNYVWFNSMLHGQINPALWPTDAPSWSRRRALKERRKEGGSREVVWKGDAGAKTRQPNTLSY